MRKMFFVVSACFLCLSLVLGCNAQSGKLQEELKAKEAAILELDNKVKEAEKKFEDLKVQFEQTVLEKDNMIKDLQAKYEEGAKPGGAGGEAVQPVAPVAPKKE